MVWLGVDYTAGHQYSHPLIPLWNAGVRLGVFLIVSHLSRRLRAVLARQASLAQQDGLPGILNSRTFLQRCHVLFQLAARHRHPMALGYADLDGFKGVNDRLGHAAGDEILKAVATAMARRLRVSDLVARLGGDEFAILLPETDLAGARHFFTEMHDILNGLVSSWSWPVGFSIGVVVFTSVPPDPEQAISCADAVMYEVKQKGKNHVKFEEYAGTQRPVQAPA